VRAWAQHGFKAIGLDVAPSAVRDSIESTNAAGLKAEFREGNFICDEPFAHFDYLFEHTLFCAINPSERDDYVRAVKRWLKPDGRYVAVFYMIPDKEGPPFGTTREELAGRFKPHFSLEEEWIPRSYPNRAGLEWMTIWRPVASHADR
jgi:SAM-dependent methyltransferase